MTLHRNRARLVVAGMAAVGLVATGASAGVGVTAVANPGDTSPGVTSSGGTELAHELVNKLTIPGVNRHLIAWQRLAARNDGTRASGTPGFDASAGYVKRTLRAAGWKVREQEFDFELYTLQEDGLTVGGTEIEADALSYSPSSPEEGATGPLVVVPSDADTGCQADDYQGVDASGAVALIRRGGCTFAQKSQVAGEQGALAAVISNNEAGALAGTLGGSDPGNVPTIGVSRSTGDRLAEQGGAETTVLVQGMVEQKTTSNVIAQTRTGRQDNVVMAGAHLDSVPAGPGVNDNGSGSATLLELAKQLGGSPDVNNAVRLAWWGAEEQGLLGSTHYVDSLSFERQLDISMYLNFDMLGSPNAAYFVYDGDDSDQEGAGPGPYGSAQIENAFQGYYDRLGVPTEGTDFDGRSDYGEFIAQGIPAGGLFSGAEDIKTEAQQQKWGGTAGIAYDPCYHQACDNLGNVDRIALGRNADAVGWVVGNYAMSTEDVNGVPPREARAAARATAHTAAAATSMAELAAAGRA